MTEAGKEAALLPVRSNAGLDERLCKCGHGINWHEDYDFDIHECAYPRCQCSQFNDRDG